MKTTKQPVTFIDRLFFDKNETLGLFQTPNLPLITYLVFTLLSKLADNKLQLGMELIAFGSLFTWAWLEIFQGSSYLRRGLGLLIMSLIIINRL